MEECAEIQKECSKCLRFGIGDKESYHNPNSSNDLSNVERLNREINDLMGMIELLQKETILDMIDDEQVDNKKEKVLRFFNEH